jgi:hypothetical protein
MRCHGRGMVHGAVLALVVLLAVATADAQVGVPPGPIVVPGGVANPGYCWAEVKLFDTLRYGPMEYCRKRLAYRPGRLECAQVGETVCWVRVGLQWTLTRTPVQQYVIPCPDGPEPPVCPRLTFR